MTGELVGGLLLAVTEVLEFSALDGAAKATEQASHLTLTWLVGIVVLLALCAIGFKKSKRSHLD